MSNTRFVKIVFIIVLALLIPVLSYTAYQFVESNKNEELLTSIYERQLESILFSVNQHCWDRFGSWAADFAAVVKSNATTNQPEQLIELVASNIALNQSIAGAFVRFSADAIYPTWKMNRIPVEHAFRDQLSGIISQNRQDINNMVQRSIEGYTRPMTFQWDMGESSVPLLVFPVIDPSLQFRDITLAGIFLDQSVFVDEVVARKFSEMNDGNFAFSIIDKRTEQMIYSTEEFTTDAYDKNESLWLLPYLDIQVKLSGTTLNEIAQTRNRTNLIFLIILNGVLILGLGYLLRNVYYEMQLAEMKTDFVANVSHELRTPLSLIRMYAETLEMERVNSDEKRQHYYRTIMNETSRLSQLINNILDFSRINSNRKEYHFAPVDLAEIVNQVVSMYQFHLEKNAFDIELHLEEDIPLVQADSESIKQAVINVLDNAVKYSRDTRYIRIELRQQQDQILLSVSDKGIGIPANEHRKILDKFYRVGSSLVHNTKGSGLGLSLVKHIMDVHNGDISVESAPGKGSTFTLIFSLHNQLTEK